MGKRYAVDRGLSGAWRFEGTPSSRLTLTVQLDVCGNRCLVGLSRAAANREVVTHSVVNSVVNYPACTA